MSDAFNGFPAPKPVSLSNDMTLSVHEKGSGLPVVLCHGFPDLALGWRHQVPALADAGFRAIAADGRGYGASSAPEDVDAYGMADLTGDIVDMLDELGIERAVLVGHDWGGWVVWGTAVLHPDRVAGVVGVCTPYIPFPPLAAHLHLTDGDVERQYVAWFQEEGVAERSMDQQVSECLGGVLRTGVPPDQVVAAAFADGRLNMNPFLHPERFPSLGDPIGPPEVLDRYVETFSRTGFRGGINWYRNIDRNATDFPEIGTAPLDLPTLMITAEWDPALTPELARGMENRCHDLEVRLIERAGHWAHQEYPSSFNEILIDWLERRFGHE